MLRSSHARIPVYVAAGLPPIAVAVFWLSSVPPLWLYLDSTAILLWPSAQVPQFPPLYPIIVHAFESLFGLNQTMLYALLFVQHSFLASAIIYLGSALERPLHAFIMSAAAVMGAWMGSFAHTASTQAFELPFLALLCGVAVRYCLQGWRLGLLPIFFVSVLGLALARHASPIFAFIVPLYFILLAVIAALFQFRSPKAGWAYMGNAIICCLCIGLALVAGSRVTRASCRAWGNDCSYLIIGRPGCHRISESFNRVPPEEKQAWLAAKTRGLPPAEAFALEAMSKGGCWLPQYTDIQKAFPNENPDRLLNAAFYHFLLSPDHFSMAHLLDQFASRPGSLDYLLSASASAVAPPHDIVRQQLGETTAHRRQLSALAEHPLVQYYSWYTNNYLNAVALASLIAMMILAWQPSTVALGVSFVVASFAYLFMVSAVTIVLAQYIAPVNFIMYVMTAFCSCMLVARVAKLRARWLADRRPEISNVSMSGSRARPQAGSGALHD
jgi:hypothetical protein